MLPSVQTRLTNLLEPNASSLEARAIYDDLCQPYRGIHFDFGGPAERSTFGSVLPRRLRAGADNVTCKYRFLRCARCRAWVTA